MSSTGTVNSVDLALSGQLRVEKSETRVPRTYLSPTRPSGEIFPYHEPPPPATERLDTDTQCALYGIGYAT